VPVENVGFELRCVYSRPVGYLRRCDGGTQCVNSMRNTDASHCGQSTQITASSLQQQQQQPVNTQTYTQTDTATDRQTNGQTGDKDVNSCVLAWDITCTTIVTTLSYKPTSLTISSLPCQTVQNCAVVVTYRPTPRSQPYLSVTFDLASLHAESLRWTTDTLLMIAQATFLLQRGHANNETYRLTDATERHMCTSGVRNYLKCVGTLLRLFSRFWRHINLHACVYVYACMNVSMHACP